MLHLKFHFRIFHLQFKSLKYDSCSHHFSTMSKSWLASVSLSGFCCHFWFCWLFSPSSGCSFSGSTGICQRFSSPSSFLFFLLKLILPWLDPSRAAPWFPKHCHPLPAVPWEFQHRSPAVPWTPNSSEGDSSTQHSCTHRSSLGRSPG